MDDGRYIEIGVVSFGEGKMLTLEESQFPIMYDYVIHYFLLQVVPGRENPACMLELQVRNY